MADKRVALITGANKGLGLEIARQLAQLKMTVIVAARDAAKAADAASHLSAESLDAHALKLDITNASDIVEAAVAVQQRFKRLDILVNNAGMSELAKEPTTQQFRTIIETNLIGQYAVTEAFLPLLKASGAGRIVNQSSMLGSLSMMSKGQGGDLMTAGYSSSKAALNMLTVVWAQRLKDTGIKVNAAHPGWVKTDMGGSGATMEIVDGAKTAVMLATLGEDGATGGFFHMNRSMPW